jgi:pilus assembly protein CpaC
MRNETAQGRKGCRGAHRAVRGVVRRGLTLLGGSLMLIAAWSGAGWLAANGQQPNFGPPAIPTALPPVPQPVTAYQAPPPATPPPRTPATELPAPRPIEGFGPGQIRLPAMGNIGNLGGDTCPQGVTPQPTPEERARAARFVQEVVEPHNTLTVAIGRTRLLILKETPKRVQIGDENIAGYTQMGPREVSVLGKRVGTTVLNLWFTDPNDPRKDEVLGYLVNVIPDPEAKARLERAYKALEKEINHLFLDSHVCLTLVGDKLVVSGQAKDIAEATDILRIVQANAPGAPGTGGTGASGVPGAGGAGAPGATGATTGVTQTAAQIPVPAVEPTIVPGPGGAPEIVPGMGSYVVRGAPQVVNLLRIPGEQQVMLKVIVAEVNRAAARSIGVNFDIFNKAGALVFANNPGSILFGGSSSGFGSGNGLGFGGLGFGFGGFGLGLGLGTTGQTLGPAGFLNYFSLFSPTDNLGASLNNGLFLLAMNALRTLDYARSLAEPNLVAMNGQTATFQSGGQFPVPVTTGYTSGGLQGVSFVPYGVQLTFTPYITDKDRIRLSVAANVSTRDLSTGSTIGGSNVSGLTTRNFQTTVELREGQSLAVAGLIQNNLGALSSRVPFFGDLPLLGDFAKFDRTSAAEQELVIIITPELVHPLEHKELPPLPGSDLFEPGDLEFYLLGRLESRRNYDYRSQAMTDIHRMLMYRRCEKLYIYGPHGHTAPPGAGPVPSH